MGNPHPREKEANIGMEDSQDGMIPSNDTLTMIYHGKRSRNARYSEG